MAMVGIEPGRFLQVALRHRDGGVACRCLLLRERFTLWVPFRFESLVRWWPVIDPSRLEPEHDPEKWTPVSLS